ncbi:MAG: hypothetical protein RDV41_02415 [Planctomycetota bacterium]|nr:hypothetical protein [Planctomycetota bacterium]
MRQNPFVLVASAIVFAGAFLAGCAGGAPPTGEPPEKQAPRDLKAVVDQGIAFLVARQNRDGSWGSFETLRPSEIYLDTVASHDAFRNATSSLCCMALMQVALEREDACAALHRGMRYLMKEEAVPRATSSTFYDTWAHCFTLQCFSRMILLRDPAFSRDELVAAAERWLRALRLMQGADGGWGYYDFGFGLRQPSGLLSTSFLTATALCAMWDAERAGIEVPGDMKRSAIATLVRYRTPDKTYVYATDSELHPGWEFNRPKGALGRSQAPNLALFLYGGAVSEADIMLGLDRMFEEHHFLAMARCRPWPHETWYYNSGYYFLYGYFNAAAVIGWLPRETQKKYWDAVVRNLLPIQESDGSWWDFPFYGYYKEYGTAFALLALVPARDFADLRVPPR